MSTQEVILLLGSNLGDRKKNISVACAEIERSIGEITEKSEFLETKPIEFCSFNNFLNFALRIQTLLSPMQLLQAIKRIEQEMGRKSDSVVAGKHEDRIIDIDIVRYADLIFWCKTLKIPHEKHLFEREFSKKLINELIP